MTVYITRCPACQQAFKITENVLQAKNGQVRCGFCQNVFNAREHLYRSIDLEGGLKRVEHEAEIERQGVASMKSLADQLKGFDAVDDNQGLVGIRVEPKNGPEKLDIINGGSNIEVITHPAHPVSETSEETEEPEEELEEEIEEKKFSKSWLWFIVAVAAVVGIGVKVLAANQNAVLAKFPQAEPLYNAICGSITCEPRQTVAPLDAPVKDEAAAKNNAAETASAPVSLLSHKLQQVEGNKYAITVELKNNTNAAQSYPILTVVMKGEKEDIITRRRLEPKEYLGAEGQTIAPQATVSASIAFDMTDGDPATLAVEIDPII